MPPLALRSSVSVHTRPATDTLAEPERRGAGAGGSRAPCEVHRRSRPSPPGSWTWLRPAGAACSTSQALADERGGDLPYSGQRGMTYGRRQHDCWWPDIHRFSHYVHAQERSDPTLVDELAIKPPQPSVAVLAPVGIDQEQAVAPPRQPVAGRDLDRRRALGAHELAIKPPHPIDRFLVADRRFVGHVSLAEVYFAGALCASCIYYLHNSKQPAAQLPHDVSEW